MNYTFTYILCILCVLFYIIVFPKINKIYHKTLHCIFFKSLHKNKRGFFPKKCSPVIIFTKKDHTKNNRATHKPITSLYI